MKPLPKIRVSEKADRIVGGVLIAWSVNGFALVAYRLVVLHYEFKPAAWVEWLIFQGLGLVLAIGVYRSSKLAIGINGAVGLFVCLCSIPVLFPLPRSYGWQIGLSLLACAFFAWYWWARAKVWRDESPQSAG